MTHERSNLFRKENPERLAAKARFESGASAMKWSILIPTADTRVPSFGRLLQMLLPQVEPYPDIEVLALYNRRTQPVGAYRQALIDAARGEYLNFVDDDDRLSAKYVSSIYPRLDGTVDYVGFRMELRIKGVLMNPVICDLDHGRWEDTDDAYYRDVNHMCPMKAAIAKAVEMPRENRFEDMSWANALRGCLKTQSFIDEVLYYYDYHPRMSLTQGRGPRFRRSRPRLVVNHPNFRYVDE